MRELPVNLTLYSRTDVLCTGCIIQGTQAVQAVRAHILTVFYQSLVEQCLWGALVRLVLVPKLAQDKNPLAAKTFPFRLGARNASRLTDPAAFPGKLESTAHEDAMSQKMPKSTAPRAFKRRTGAAPRGPFGPEKDVVELSIPAKLSSPTKCMSHTLLPPSWGWRLFPLPDSQCLLPHTPCMSVDMLPIQESRTACPPMPSFPCALASNSMLELCSPLRTG